jgi:hypothetical protein
MLRAPTDHGMVTLGLRQAQVAAGAMQASREKENDGGTHRKVEEASN